MPGAKPADRTVLRSLGLGLITGAADDDPSAIGTFASAGAKLGAGFLWVAPVIFPMMFAVVYLSSKLGQVTGKGLFGVIRDHYPRWILYAALTGVMIGNTIEAAADIGGMAAAIGVLAPGQGKWLVIATTLAILCLQLWGSYQLIRGIFRWMALILLTYVGAAVLAKPDWREVLKGTLVPTLRLDREFLSLLVAIIGTTLSAYLVTWQSNEEVEEKVAAGQTRLSERRGASEEELARSRRDVLFGMFFSSIILYFIMLATASTLHKTGVTDIENAAQAALALRPMAGRAAGILFAVGVVGVGFLAVPIMTTGAAYDLCQTLGWKNGLGLKPAQAKKFYGSIVVFTAIAMGMNFLGFNPMKALVWAGIVQGFSTPPLMLMILLMTRSRQIMGDRVNGRAMNLLGWVTVTAIFAASAGLVVTWLM